MSTILDTIIARGFNLNQPEFGNNFVAAKNQRQALDSSLQSQALQREAVQFDMDQARQAAADQAEVGRLFGQFVGAPQAVAKEIGMAQDKAMANFREAAAQGKVNPAYEQKALEMINSERVRQYGMNAIGERQQQALMRLAERSPEVQNALIRAFMTPQEAKVPATQLGKLQLERDQLAAANPNDPRIADYDAAISKLITPAAPDTIKIENRMGNAEGKGLDQAARLAATNLSEADAEVKKAYTVLNQISFAKDQLKKGIISGTGADFRLGFAKFLSTIGIGDGTAENTQAYIAATSGLVADVIGQFGAGSGLSDADREFARQMAAGSIELNERSLARILDLNARAQIAKINNFNSLRQNIARPDAFPAIGGLYQDAVVPDFKFEPSVLDGYDLTGMTPEEVRELEMGLLSQ